MSHRDPPAGPLPARVDRRSSAQRRRSVTASLGQQRGDGAAPVPHAPPAAAAVGTDPPPGPLSAGARPARSPSPSPSQGEKKTCGVVTARRRQNRRKAVPRSAVGSSRNRGCGVGWSGTRGCQERVHRPHCVTAPGSDKQWRGAKASRAESLSGSGWRVLWRVSVHWRGGFPLGAVPSPCRGDSATAHFGLHSRHLRGLGKAPEPQPQSGSSPAPWQSRAAFPHGSLPGRPHPNSFPSLCLSSLFGQGGKPKWDFPPFQDPAVICASLPAH